MRRKLQFHAAALLGAAMLMFPTIALGAPGGGGGGRGGGVQGGGHSILGPSGGNVGRSIGNVESHVQSGAISTLHGGNGVVGSLGHSNGIAQGEWRHTQAWNNWGHGEALHHDHNSDHDRRFFGFGLYAPFYYPWDYGFPSDYSLGGYNDVYPYYNGYEDYGDSSANDFGEQSAAAPSEPVVEQGSAPSGNPGNQFFEEARQAFRNGDYRGALKLAQHAAVEDPRDPAVHELMSLALFALKDYRGAALEAHTALKLGPPIDWPTLYAYYGNADTYTSQLRALESFVRENPKTKEGHFLLAYQYIMMGSKDTAKTELAKNVEQNPTDDLADRLSAQLMK